jgi:hypothetical protein
MNPAKIISEIYNRGLLVKVESGDIVLDGPEKAFTSDIIRIVRENKPLLVEYLSPVKNVICFCCYSNKWWRLPDGGKWVCGVCHPPALGFDKVEWKE